MTGLSLSPMEATLGSGEHDTEICGSQELYPRCTFSGRGWRQALCRRREPVWALAGYSLCNNESCLAKGLPACTSLKEVCTTLCVPALGFAGCSMATQDEWLPIPRRVEEESFRPLKFREEEVTAELEESYGPSDFGPLGLEHGSQVSSQGNVEPAYWGSASFSSKSTGTFSSRVTLAAPSTAGAWWLGWNCFSTEGSLRMFLYLPV